MKATGLTFAALLFVAGAAWAAPRIDRVEPAEGPTEGGTRVVIRGSGFAPGAKVTFDGDAAREVRVVDPTRIEAVTPPVARRAAATVAVENPDGEMGEHHDAFRFHSPYDWLRTPGLVLLIAFLIFLGAPLFLILGAISVYCFGVYLEWPALGAWLDRLYALFNPFVDAMYRMITGNETLLAIPFFILSGEIMTAGSIAEKLVNFAKALLGWMPGGLAVAAVGACMFFAAISGSSPVTVIAIGSIMFPALVREHYPERFSLGLVTSAGSLGILIPPSIPMIVYVIMVGGGFLVEDLFKAGVGPGFVLGGLLMGYSILVARRTPAIRARTAQRPGFAEWMRNVRATFLDGFWALMLPVVILGGIYGGLFSATAAGVVSVAYAYIVEAFVHRDIRQRDVPKILVEASILMGSILIILAFAFAFNYFLSARKIPNAAAQWLGSLELGPVAFMIILNGLLLVVGCLMDIMSAIMILAPLIAPMATQVGIDPIHLGIVFIVNLEIGYLTPPIGLNLFVSCTLFKKPFGQVVRSVLPFTVVMLGGLLLITYVPTVSLGIGGLFDAGKPFYVPFPDAPTRAAAVAAPDKPPEKPAKAPDTPGAAFPPATPGKVQSLKELMRRAAEPEEDKDEKDEEPPAPTPDAGKAPATKKKVKSLKELMREAGEPDEE